MKNVISALVLLAAALALISSPAAAQTKVTLDFMHVQLWPEYDQPSVLVIYDFQTPAQASYPQQIQLRLPKDANLLAVAQQSQQSLLTLPYDNPVAQGDWLVLSFAAPAAGVYRVEYYVPFSKTGITRTYKYSWPGDYAVKEFAISAQEPAGSAHLTTTPALADVSPSTDGFTYHRGTIGPLTDGQTFDLNISYSKADDALSVTGNSIQPAGGSLNGSQTSFTSFLPWIIGALGVLLIVGGGVWYWVSGRAQAEPARPRHHSAAAENAEAEDGQRYCAQCGKRAQAGDRFCRACGTRIPAEK